MSRRVLRIEDNEQNRYRATYLLERHGYAVGFAVDGANGVAAASEDPPDLILLDIQLPAMDGYEVARALRRVAALEAGCTGYIEKPIDPERFVHTGEELSGWPRTEPRPA